MITTETTLILGAGARAPYEFPTGRSLLVKIAQDLKSNTSKLSSSIQGHFEKDSISQFREALEWSQQPSVDLFLEKRSEFMTIGKYAIAASLIPFESPDRFSRSGPTESSKPPPMRWYEYLFRRLDAEPDDFPGNQLSIITFKYDRSLEYFLSKALEFSYGLSTEDALTFLAESIPIIHVYGQLGPFGINSSDRPYTPKFTDAALRKSVEGIKIMNEGSDNSEEFEKARIQIKKSEKLCFLGFGYHPINIRRLAVNKTFKGRYGVMGTSYGLEDAERKEALQNFGGEIQERLNNTMKPEPILSYLRKYSVLT